MPVHDRPHRRAIVPIVVEPRESNGLSAESRLMVDKITTVRRSKLEDQIGVLDDADVVRLNRSLVVFLGIAVSG